MCWWIGSCRTWIETGRTGTALASQRGMSRARRLTAIAVAAVLVAITFANASALAPAPDHRWSWLAHRGVAQSFPLDGIENDTCTATRIRPVQHPFLENTLLSMREAFRRGAAVVELDLHRSRDGVLVVFHDATLDCRTDGHGAPEAHTVAELRALDVGFGYSADGGRTFPLWGTGVGLLPTLDEVLDAFPDRALLLHLKTNDPGDGDLLADALALRPDTLTRRFVYGGEQPVARVRARLPMVRSFDKAQEKACGLAYLLGGWTGHIPVACRQTMILVPIDLAPLLWGWPRRFEARMASVGTPVVLVGPRTASGWISGIDAPEGRDAVPDDFGGWVWTNRIDVVGD